MKRKGGVPPIVTVLVVIASIVAAALVAWFIYTSTRGAVNQPVFEVISAYAVASGGTRTLSVTVKYINGPSNIPISVTSVAVGTITCSGPTITPSTVSPGQTSTVRATCSTGSSLDGQSGALELTVGSGGSSSRILLGFRVTEP